MKPTAKTEFKTVDDYFSSLPESTKRNLSVLRKTIRQAAPKAVELISYNMPAFKLNGMLVYYAAYNQHIGFYPHSSAIKFFKDELTAYETSKGTIRFPLDKPLPLGLITKIVKFRVKENLSKSNTKTKK